ncbi:MAG TPA: hypothetical protein VI796_02510 [Candidatus Thermoplasmatota archaeon]|nr:hypothetical protein [Candidatus Thermoplasmatota archaeon]
MDSPLLPGRVPSVLVNTSVDGHFFEQRYLMANEILFAQDLGFLTGQTILAFLTPERESLSALEIVNVLAILAHPHADWFLPAPLAAAQWQTQYNQSGASRNLVLETLSDGAGGPSLSVHIRRDASTWPAEIRIEGECLADSCPLPVSTGRRIVRTFVNETRTAEAALPEGIVSPRPWHEESPSVADLDPGGLSLSLPDAVQEAKEQSTLVRDYMASHPEWIIVSARFDGTPVAGESKWIILVAARDSREAIEFQVDSDLGRIGGGTPLVLVSNVKGVDLNDGIGLPEGWRVPARESFYSPPLDCPTAAAGSEIVSLEYRLGGWAKKDEPQPSLGTGFLMVWKRGIGVGCADIQSGEVFGLQGPFRTVLGLSGVP